MRFFYIGKDGGKNSNVTGCWLFELKSLFSIAILRFDKGSREAYHSHAFHAISWILKGNLTEYRLNSKINILKPTFLPIFTSKQNIHKVYANEVTYALTFRGPWNKYWTEYNPNTKEWTKLTHGRKIIDTWFANIEDTWNA